MSAQEKFGILLVDDDTVAIRLLSRILSDFAPLRFATSGHAALKLARESIPDLVLLDVDMPEFSGFEVCKAFKSDAALAAVPIIFISSHESPLLQAKGFEVGAADFIIKPPSAPLVLARVRAHQRLKALSETLSNTLRGAMTMDFLTGMVSRREFDRIATQEWLRAQRSAGGLGLLLADIDGFTDYNAEWGEERGDACLKAVADGLRSIVHRPTDVVGRYAGGKFALLLPDTDRLGSTTVAQRAIEVVDALLMPYTASADRRRGITLSVGGGHYDASRPTTAKDGAGVALTDLVAAAERALTSAKSAGGHQVRFIAATRVNTAEALSQRA
jgi:diguanylate cyclase (GGDEF)-like protein